MTTADSSAVHLRLPALGSTAHRPGWSKVSCSDERLAGVLRVLE
jgi:hypothetical protein